MKIIDKVKAKMLAGEKFFSFEYFPPRTEEGVENLLDRQERMVEHGPVFCDITWGAGGTTSDVTLDIATKMQNQICIDTMMHLTCTNITIDKIDEALKQAKKNGIHNILALRGDPPKGQEKFEVIDGGFSCALDLVRYIRKEFGDFFCVAVAGYPEAHPDTIVDDPEQMEKNYWSNIEYLKQKVLAGGDLIITQLFYDIEIFFKFVKDCRSVGIEVPILPGIMPIMTYGGFKRMTGFCKTKVPKDLADKVEELKDNEEGLKAYGIEHGANMCRQLMANGIPGLHLYSLNLEATVLGILQRVGFIDIANVPKPLPWKHVPRGTRRVVEGVRPIFWAQRGRSYIKRTNACETFPTIRWESSACSLGPLPAPEALRCHTASAARKEKALAAWGPEVTSVDDIKAVFAKYYNGEVSILPWTEAAFNDQNGLLSKLMPLINKGLLPVNSQGAINGVASNDSKNGWGGVGGHVYQKAFVEFFTSPEQFKELLPKLQANPSLTFLASNKAGDMTCSSSAAGVNTVSWGVFPGKEVLQPYIFDKTSFSAWKDEAFALWTAEWGAVFPEDSPSMKVLQDVGDSWYLVSILDHDYTSDGSLFKTIS